MNVTLKYSFEDEHTETLDTVNDFFCAKGMDSEIMDGYVFSVEETTYASDEPVENYYLKTAFEDYKKLKEILNTDFSLSGVIDTSDSSGECMDFLFESHEGLLSVKTSDWYIETSMDIYEDYEDFCDSFFECSPEEYESVKDCEFVYILETENGEILSAEVPLYEINADRL